MKRTIAREDGVEIVVWDEMVWRAEVDQGVDGQYLTGYHADEADAIAEAESWLDAPRLPEDLDAIAEMFVCAAAELRGARFHDGAMTQEQRRVLLVETLANTSRIIEAIRVARKGAEWEHVMDALDNLYSARRHGVDKDYHVDVLMEAFEGWRS